jgi:hypothetical protein
MAKNEMEIVMDLHPELGDDALIEYIENHSEEEIQDEVNWAEFPDHEYQ